jgi:hypothetical protein
MTIAAPHREDAVPVRTAAKAQEVVHVAVVALQGRISRRVTVLAAWMHEDRVGLHEGAAGARTVLGIRRP